MAKMNSSDNTFNDDLSSRVAFHVGGIVDISFSDKFSVQPEILYSSVGATYSTSSSSSRDVFTDFDYITDYITIPVIAKYYVNDGLSIEVGPQIGFLLSANGKFENGDKENFKDEIESTDFGVGFGAGYKLDNGSFFNTRYYVLGLTNFSKDSR